MTKKVQIIIWIVVAVLVILGIWWFVSMKAPVDTTNTANVSSTGNVVSPTPTDNAQAANQSASVDQSTTNIDSEMTALHSDSANMNQGSDSSIQ